MSGPTKFQSFCQALVDSLNVDVENVFRAIETDFDRVSFLYRIGAKLKIEVERGNKNIDRSESLKQTGNKLFKSRNFFEALSVYNEAILYCPQDTPAFSALIGNRTAVFFETKCFEKVIKDAEVVKQIRNHPSLHKILVRAGRAAEALKCYKTALLYFEEAYQHLKQNEEVDMPDRTKQLADVEAKIKQIKPRSNKDTKNLLLDDDEVVWQSRNMTYPALSVKLGVKSSKSAGRYVVAKEKISAGEIVAVEEPYAVVIDGNTYRTNCAFCIKSTDQPIPCESCSNAVFCSFKCKEAATKFHKVECQILRHLFEIGVSVNCLMALRMISQRSLQHILDSRDELQKKQSVVIYKGSDYFNVYNLVSHKETRSCKEYIHYTFMSTYLLRLLKTTEYFGGCRKDDVLLDDEIYVGSLILLNLQILQFNAHEISELQNSSDGEYKYVTASTGAGVYPTLALFNHSCDPSVIRYNVGSLMVLRAVKPIEANDEVYENYGPLYTNQKRNERQTTLSALYMFECECKACTHNWPMFKDIQQNILRIKCECGNTLCISKELTLPVAFCNDCKDNKSILPVLTQLIPLESKSQKMEDLYYSGLYKEAVPLIADIMDIQHKVLAPPYQDMILLQQKLRGCLVHYGNKKFDYKIM